MSSQEQTILTAVGDLMFYGPLAEQMLKNDDPLWSFEPLGDALLRGHLLFGNLETPISATRVKEPGVPGMYCAAPGIGRALKNYGFSVVNLAHNHIYDFGIEGVECTLAELRSAELPHIGIGRTPDEASAPAVVLTKNGQRIGFLGYTTANNALDHSHKYIGCFPDPERVSWQVRELRKTVDAVVVSCHTGAQYNPYPAPETRKLARAAIGAGASVFLGHHPHVPQGIERIDDGLAVYSLGDFAAPPHTEQTRRTFFIRIQLMGDKVQGYEVVPCYIGDTCRTSLAHGEEETSIREHIHQLSASIADNSSDELHFRWAHGRFYSQYVASWVREFRAGGMRAMWRKVRSFRLYHFQLIWYGIRSRLSLRKSKGRG